jgi:hypothetical protein
MSGHPTASTPRWPRTRCEAVGKLSSVETEVAAAACLRIFVLAIHRPPVLDRAHPLKPAMPQTHRP